MTVVDFGPTLVNDVGDAARRVLPMGADSTGGWMIRVDREAPARVKLSIAYLKATSWTWSESPVVAFKVRPGDDVAAEILEHLPELPLCRCGCGRGVTKAGKVLNGHNGRNRNARAAAPDLSNLPSRGQGRSSSALVPTPGASSNPARQHPCEGGLA